MHDSYSEDKVASININGVDVVGGNSISIVGGRVIVDGVEVNIDGITGTNTREVLVRVEGGTVGDLTTDGSVKCSDVTGNVNARGSVNCDNIGGAVDAGGSVNCDDVEGSVRAGGSVNCGDVGGAVSAGGSVRHG